MQPTLCGDRFLHVPAQPDGLSQGIGAWHGEVPVIFWEQLLQAVLIFYAVHSIF